MAGWLFGALLVAARADAESVVVSGRGPERTDCLASWVLELDGQPSHTAVRKARMECEDGAAWCDADGSPDGQCTFRLQICFGQDMADTACDPKPMGIYDLKLPSRRSARRRATARSNRAAILDAVAALTVPIMPGQCTGDVLIRVPLNKKGRTGKVVLRSRALSADGREIDKDRLRLRCKRASQPSSQSSHQRLAVILTSDFTNTGAYSTVTLDKPRSVRADLGETYSDAVGRVFQNRLYVVNRLGQDNIQVIKPATGTSVAACSIKNAANPQDIAFADENKAYVSRMRDGIVTIIDPTVPRTCSRFKRGRVNLGRFADADGSPELGRMLILGDRLYVAVLRLDRNRRFVPAASGLIAVIDTTTDKLVDVDPTTPEVDAIRLAGENPFGLVYDASSAKIWVWEAGSFSVSGDGGIEAIDPATNRSEGFIATEADLGGTVTAVAPYTETRAFAIVAYDDSRNSYRNRLVAFSPVTGEILDTLRDSTSYLPDVAVNDRNEVWLADRTITAPGIRIFDADSGRAVAGPIDVGLPPFIILFLP